MAKRPSKPAPLNANLSAQQMREAIPKIERRISDLEQFDPSTVVDRSDPRILALSNRLDTLLSNIFGAGTVEYEKYQGSVTQLDTASHSFYLETPLHEVREGLQKGISNSIHQLKSIKEDFEEELSDTGGTPASKALRAYEGLDIHPVIEDACGQLYRDGHYANAVEDAVKALNDLVRMRSKVEKDGTSLMETVFNPSSPILKFNDLADQSDKDEQKGFMMLFSGAVSGLRNPRAHKLIKDDPAIALEFIAFVSLLAQMATKANR